MCFLSVMVSDDDEMCASSRTSLRHRILIVVVHFKEAARRVSGGASLDTRTTEGRRELDMRATTSTILYCGPHLYCINSIAPTSSLLLRSVQLRLHSTHLFRIIMIYLCFCFKKHCYN